MYDSDFYKNLKKPPLMPNANVFKIAWGILYSLLLVSILLVLTSDSDEKILGITAFVVQLGLNILWPIVFFRYKNIGLGLFVSILLFISIIVMIIVFFDISKLGGMLQIPYLIWSIFAIYLNSAIFFLNRK